MTPFLCFAEWRSRGGAWGGRRRGWETPDPCLSPSLNIKLKLSVWKLLKRKEVEEEDSVSHIIWCWHFEVSLNIHGEPFSAFFWECHATRTQRTRNRISKESCLTNFVQKMRRMVSNKISSYFPPNRININMRLAMRVDGTRTTTNSHPHLNYYYRCRQIWICFCAASEEVEN